MVLLLSETVLPVPTSGTIASWDTVPPVPATATRASKSGAFTVNVTIAVAASETLVIRHRQREDMSHGRITGSSVSDVKLVTSAAGSLGATELSPVPPVLAQA